MLYPYLYIIVKYDDDTCGEAHSSTIAQRPYRVARAADQSPAWMRNRLIEQL